MARSDDAKRGLFHWMASYPLPFCLFLPCVFAVFIGLGWRQDDIIEESVARIWIPTKGDHAVDTEYAEQHGYGFSSTTMSAAAIARDDGNLFTEDRLEAIRARMEKMEKTTVSGWVLISNGSSSHKLVSFLLDRSRTKT